MKKTVCIFFLIIFFWSNEQVSQANFNNAIAIIQLPITYCQQPTSSYAVVVGISDYQNTAIPDLQYAQKDAQAFKQFLKSPAGGSVAENHIIFLENEKATAGQFAAALDWLLQNVKEGDRAIIYFAGHADIERKTITQPGFLLCWDSPEKVYMGGGTFGLAYLKDIISILSNQLKANVMLIADLSTLVKAGEKESDKSDNILNYLAHQDAHEIRFVSCHSKEYSVISSQISTTGSVFNYYLVNGLSGLADQNQDGAVSLAEMENYYADNIPESHYGKNFYKTVGLKNKIISSVNTADLLTQQQYSYRSILTGALPASNSVKDNYKLYHTTNLDFIEKYNELQNALQTKHLVTPEENSAWSIYQQLRNEAMDTFDLVLIRSQLAAAFQDEAQQAINDYLKSDPGELRKRWSFDDHYEKFTVYLNKAAELLGESHFLYKSIKSREHYFAGLMIRLKGEQMKDTTFYRKAIAEQNITLGLDSNATFAFNELGILEKKFKNYQRSINYFKQAILQSPDWVLPWTNLTNSYIDLKNYTSAIQSGLKSISIDSNSALAHYNLAIAYKFQTDTNKAIFHFIKTLGLDSTDKEASYSLSSLYYQKGNYQGAREVILKYLKQYPKDSVIYVPFTFVNIQLGDYEMAIHSLENAFKNGFDAIKSFEEEPEVKDFILNPKYLALKKKYFRNEK